MDNTQGRVADKASANISAEELRTVEITGVPRMTAKEHKPNILSKVAGKTIVFIINLFFSAGAIFGVVMFIAGMLKGNWLEVILSLPLLWLFWENKEEMASWLAWPFKKFRQYTSKIKQ